MSRTTASWLHLAAGGLVAAAGALAGCSGLGLSGAATDASLAGPSTAGAEEVIRLLARPPYGPVDLDVAVLVHPRCAVEPAGDAAATSRRRVFGRVATNLLDAAFRSTIAIREEGDIHEIERQRDKLVRSGQQPFWLLDPNAVVVVDYRPPYGPLGRGQLSVRVLDLKLARLCGLSAETLDRELHTKRALVVEEYEDVAASGSDAELAAALIESWRRLLPEVLSAPRLKRYLQAISRLESLEAQGPPLQVPATVLADFFGRVGAGEPGDGAVAAAAAYFEHVESLERLLLFDDDRGPAAPEAPGDGKPCE